MKLMVIGACMVSLAFGFWAGMDFQQFRVERGYDREPIRVTASEDGIEFQSGVNAPTDEQLKSINDKLTPLNDNDPVYATQPDIINPGQHTYFSDDNPIHRRHVASPEERFAATLERIADAVEKLAAQSVKEPK